MNTLRALGVAVVVVGWIALILVALAMVPPWGPMIAAVWMILTVAFVSRSA